MTELECSSDVFLLAKGLQEGWGASVQDPNLQNLTSKDHFSVTYGHIGGSGSAEESATTEGTTQAIYKQFFNFLW